VFVAPLGCELVETQNAQNKHALNKVTSGPRPLMDERPLSMLNYYSWIQQRPISELEREYTRLEERAKDSDARRDRLRLALLLSLSGTPFSDDSRALAVLERYLGFERSGGEDEAFALFLLELLEERERFKSQVKTLASQLKDFQIVMNELQKERALRNKLEGQVQQLKNIEENLMEREQSNSPPSME
jgi:hypothetical protein